MLTNPMRVLSWKCSEMMGKEDDTVPEWVKSHLQYMQVIPSTRGNPDCEVGFASASKREISHLRSCVVMTLRGKTLQQSSDPEWGNPIVG